jgi:hypothetical protein
MLKLMRKEKNLPVCLMIIFAVFVLNACELSDVNSRQSFASLLGLSEPAQGGDDSTGIGIQALLADQGLTVVNAVTCRDPKSGKSSTGYLATFDNKFTEGTNAAGMHVGPLPKYSLVLTGSSYCMGYQMASLKPAETAKMCNEYIFTIPGALGLTRSNFGLLFDYFKNVIIQLCQVGRASMPDYLQEEMQGIVDGAQAQGYSVPFENVLLLNEGIDSIYSLLLTGVVPSILALNDVLDSTRADLKRAGKENELEQLDQIIQVNGGTVVFPSASSRLMGCNEFVVSGNATENGDVYHGRDFMFTTGSIYQDYCCMAVYLPDEGYPFVTVTAPGFVGNPTMLNSAGLSMGIDVVNGAARPTPGLGGLLVLRDIVQHCATLDQAVARMKKQDRGVPWLYAIAADSYSPSYTNGIVIEEGRSDPSFTGPDVMISLERALFKAWIDKLDPTDLPDKGLMIRPQNWVYPTAFEHVSIGYPGYLTYMLCFPEQMESWPDVVMCTNHYIIPRMVFTTFSPLLMLEGAGFMLWESNRRYKQLYELISEQYGHISFDTAVQLIDFLNPNRGGIGTTWPESYKNGGEVGGHHAAIDNSSRVIQALYGYYGDWKAGVPDTWVRIDLKPFAEYLKR